MEIFGWNSLSIDLIPVKISKFHDIRYFTSSRYFPTIITFLIFHSVALNITGKNIIHLEIITMKFYE